MISDRRISQLLRDRAVEVDVCIEWLLATIHLQDPKNLQTFFLFHPLLHLYLIAVAVIPNVILSTGSNLLPRSLQLRCVPV